MKISKISYDLMRFICVILFFVSPLLFFTNLTRNPYFFQIALVNVSIAICCIVMLVELFKQRYILLHLSPFHFIFAGIILVFFITSIYGYLLHLDFFRQAIINENKRIWFYTIFNAFIPFFLASQISCDEKKNNSFPYSLLFVFLWGISWFFFKIFKTAHPFFDLYGIFLWLWGGLYVFSKTELDFRSIIHIAMLSGFYASVYGVLQYFGLEIIWDKNLTPYGRRAVTTFGNPNFASSYMLILFPFAFYYWVILKDKIRNIYFAIMFSFISMIFASLTRSSIIALVFEIVFLVYYFKKKKIIAASDFKKFVVFLILLSFFWPDQSLNFFGSGVIKRFKEAIVLSVKQPNINVTRENVYPSFHQRLLIWRCGVDMFLENPLTGKGWGNFELFYPFYQGWYLRVNSVLKNLRTHANNAHNEVIEILSQTGIIGFGVVILFLVSLGFHIYKNLSDSNKLIIIISISIAAMIIDNMLNVSIHFAVPGLLFFSLLGSLVWHISYNKMVRFEKFRYLFPLIIIVMFFYIFSWIRYFKREVWYFAGFKEMRKGNYISAKIYLEKAFSAHPYEVNTNYELANSYVKNGDFKKALEAYSYSLKANAGYDEIYFNMAIVQKNLGLFEEALKNLRTSIWINPGNEKAYYAYAEIASKMNNAESLNIIEDGCRNHPDDGYMLWLCGYFKENGKNIAEAEKYYAAAVFSDPVNSVYIESLKKINPKSFAIEFSDLYRKAVIENSYNIKTAFKIIAEIEKHPYNSYRLKYLKAKLMYDSEDYERALTLLNDLILEKPDFYIALKSLALVYEKMGKNDLAIHFYERYLSYKPDSQDVRSRIDFLKKVK